MCTIQSFFFFFWLNDEKFSTIGAEFAKERRGEIKSVTISNKYV